MGFTFKKIRAGRYELLVDGQALGKSITRIDEGDYAGQWYFDHEGEIYPTLQEAKVALISALSEG